MNAVDVKCPICDTLNKSLNLAETDGWMECECCGNVVQIMKYARSLKGWHARGCAFDKTRSPRRCNLPSYSSASHVARAFAYARR